MHRRNLERILSILLVGGALWIVVTGIWAWKPRLTPWDLGLADPPGSLPNPTSVLSSDPWDSSRTVATEHLLLGRDARNVFPGKQGGPLWIIDSDAWTRFDRRTGTAARYPARHGASDAYQAHAGAPVWFATPEGLRRFDPHEARFTDFMTADGLTHKKIQWIHAKGDGNVLLLGSEEGLIRFDTQTGVFTRYTEQDGLLGSPILSMQATRRGEDLWLFTGSALQRMDLRSETFTTHPFPQGLGGFLGIYQTDQDDVPWLVTRDAISRLGAAGEWIVDHRLKRKPPEGETAPVTVEEDLFWRTLKHRNCLVVRPKRHGPNLWFFTHRVAFVYDRSARDFSFKTSFRKQFMPGCDLVQGTNHNSELWFRPDQRSLIRWVYDGDLERNEIGSLLRIAFPSFSRPRLALLDDYVVRSRPAGLLFTSNDGAEVTAFPIETAVLDLEAGPDNRVWTASRLAGLGLRGADGLRFDLTRQDGLPSMDVHALAGVPGADGRKVWAATAGGAALVAMNEDGPRVERTATWRDALPTGPVDALAPLADGSVFLAYNGIGTGLIPDPELARLRKETHVRHLLPNGVPGLEIPLPADKVYDLELSDRGRCTLWAATSQGLFFARDPLRPGTVFRRVEKRMLRAKAVEVDARGGIWIFDDPWHNPRHYRQPNATSSVFGYHPVTGAAVRLQTSNGLPASDIDDIAFTDQGRMVVLSGSQLAKGRPRVPLLEHTTFLWFLQPLIWGPLLIRWVSGMLRAAKNR